MIFLLFLTINVYGKRIKGANFCQTLERFQQLENVCSCSIIQKQNQSEPIQDISITPKAITTQDCNNDYDSYGDCVEAILNLGKSKFRKTNSKKIRSKFENLMPFPPQREIKMDSHLETPIQLNNCSSSSIVVLM